jgi:hypothetical protein
MIIYKILWQFGIHMWPVSKRCGHFVHKYFPVLVYCNNKNLATHIRTSVMQTQRTYIQSMTALCPDGGVAQWSSQLSLDRVTVGSSPARL